MGWRGWIRGEQYGDFLVLPGKPFGQEKEKLIEILTIQARRTTKKFLNG